MTTLLLAVGTGTLADSDSFGEFYQDVRYVLERTSASTLAKHFGFV